MVSEKKLKLKRISIIILTVLLVYTAVSLVVTKLVYDGIFDRYDEQVVVPEALSETIEQRQLHQYPSGDNLLTGYYYPRQDAHGLVVLAPGFHAGADSYLWQTQDLLERGWAVFSFDPTGSFRSEGTSQVGFSQTVVDLEATLLYIEKNNNFGYNDIVLFGHSRGGYAACCMLARENGVSAVVSVSGVNSAMEAVLEMSSDAVGPLAYCNYGFLWLYQAELFGKDVLQQQACEAIDQSQIPVLVVHGTQDDMDDALVMAHKEQIHSQNVEYLVCQAGHTDLLYDADGTANDDLMEQIHAFMLRSIER